MVKGGGECEDKAMAVLLKKRSWLNNDNRSRRLRSPDEASEAQSPLAMQPGSAEFSGGRLPADAERH